MSNSSSKQTIENKPQDARAVEPFCVGDNRSHSKRLISRLDAARLLTDAGFPISAATLAKKAVTGGGPPYRIWNRRAMYEAERLMSWATDRLGPELLNTAQRH